MNNLRYYFQNEKKVNDYKIKYIDKRVSNTKYLINK